MTFRVLSRSVWNKGAMDGQPPKGGQESWMVDLEAYWGHGKCDCDHFRYRLEPDISRKVMPTPEMPMECWHLVQARRHFMRQLYKELRKVMKDGHREP